MKKLKKEKLMKNKIKNRHQKNLYKSFKSAFVSKETILPGSKKILKVRFMGNRDENSGLVEKKSPKKLTMAQIAMSGYHTM